MLTGFIDAKFPKWAKILLCIFGGASFVYRLFLFIDDCIAGKEQKNIKALIGAILCVVTFGIVEFILFIVDLIALITKNEFGGLLR